MIWEVDENLDGCVDWNEFYLMFVRNINDSSGLEPSQLFSVVQFMMFDKDGGGTVSADECMEMIYMRYGKDQLEAKMADLFAADDGDGTCMRRCVLHYGGYTRWWYVYETLRVTLYYLLIYYGCYTIWEGTRQ